MRPPASKKKLLKSAGNSIRRISSASAIVASFNAGANSAPESCAITVIFQFFIFFFNDTHCRECQPLTVCNLISVRKPRLSVATWRMKGLRKDDLHILFLQSFWLVQDSLNIDHKAYAKNYSINFPSSLFLILIFAPDSVH